MQKNQNSNKKNKKSKQKNARIRITSVVRPVIEKKEMQQIIMKKNQIRILDRKYIVKLEKLAKLPIYPDGHLICDKKTEKPNSVYTDPSLITTLWLSTFYTILTIGSKKGQFSEVKRRY